jgi:hypothetical protein
MADRLMPDEQGDALSLSAGAMAGFNNIAANQLPSGGRIRTATQHCTLCGILRFELMFFAIYTERHK